MCNISSKFMVILVVLQLVLHLYTLCPSCGLYGSFLRYFDKLSRHSIVRINYFSAFLKVAYVFVLSKSVVLWVAVFMYCSSSTFCMLFRCWWQHYGCRWESATLFSLIFGCICYFRRLVLLSSHSLSLSISPVSCDIYLRTNSNQTWFIIELTQIKF